MASEELSLVEQTEQKILKYIATDLKGGQLPKENELSELLGVSRVVVREALSCLRALGIIETKRKKGTVVLVPEIFGAVKKIIASGLLDIESLRDIYQMRIMLEIGMADFIFLNRTDEQMSKLESIVAEEVALESKMNAAEDDEGRYEVAKELTSVDIRFHSMLFEMTGNKSLIDFQYILRHLFTLYYPHIRKDWHTRTIVTHVGLYNILANGNADAFRSAMRLHLKTQFDNMEKILSKTYNK